MTESGLKRLKKAQPDVLLSVLRGEHPQTLALILAHLDIKQAAGVIEAMEPDLAGDVLFRVARMEKVSPEMLALVESALGSKADLSLSQEMKLSGGPSAVANVLNLTSPSLEKSLMEAIGARDQDLANQIKGLMFVFEDLTLLDGRAMQRVLRDVEGKELALALKAASDELKQHILKNMSERAAAALQEEIEYLGPVKVKDVEAAHLRIIQAVRVARGGRRDRDQRTRGGRRCHRLSRCGSPRGRCPSSGWCQRMPLTPARARGPVRRRSWRTPRGLEDGRREAADASPTGGSAACARRSPARPRRSRPSAPRSRAARRRASTRWPRRWRTRSCSARSRPIRRSFATSSAARSTPSRSRARSRSGSTPRTSRRWGRICDLFAPGGRRLDLRWVAEPSVQRGGFVIETPLRVVDGRVDRCSRPCSSGCAMGETGLAPLRALGHRARAPRCPASRCTAGSPA